LSPYRLVEVLISEQIVVCSTKSAKDVAMDKNAKISNGKLKKSDSCSWTGPFNTVKEHLSTNCMYFSVKCTLAGCNTIVQRKDMDQHISECLKRFVTCEHCHKTQQIAYQSRHERFCEKRRCHKVLKRKQAEDETETETKMESEGRRKKGKNEVEVINLC
jgi:hypothetical protein